MNDFSGIVSCMFLVWLFTWMFTEPPVYPESVQYAQDKCKNNSGWKYIEEGYNLRSTVYCNNGAEFNYDSSEISKKEMKDAD